MNKFMNFSANVQNVFNNDVNDFMEFSNLLTDVALGTSKVSKEEANAKIVEVFQGVLGITKDSRPADVRRALRRNQALVFDIIEETIQSLLITGWGNDPFFQKYVDAKYTVAEAAGESGFVGLITEEVNYTNSVSYRIRVVSIG